MSEVPRSELKKIAEQLNSEVKYLSCCDKTHQWRKIVIEYDREKK